MKDFVEKLIDRLETEKAKSIYDSDSVGNVKSAWNKAIEIVNQLAEEYRQDLDKDSQSWIPCSERLPELIEGTEYFKQSKCCLIAVEWWDGDITESVGWYNQSGVWNEDSKNCKVIAWQPLPAPYQPKGE